MSFGFSISLYQLYKELKKLASYRHPTATPQLTNSNKNDRVAHANMILNSNINDWIFTDQCILQLFWNKRRTWIRKGRKQRITQSNNFRQSIMVWGGITYHGKTELWINYDRQRVNSNLYCSIIEDFAGPFIKKKYPRGAKILHDRATPHIARNTANTLEDYNLILNSALFFLQCYIFAHLEFPNFDTTLRLKNVIQHWILQLHLLLSFHYSCSWGSTQRV